VISYGPARPSPLRRSRSSLLLMLAASVPPRRRVAPLTALFYRPPSLQRLTDIGPQRDIACADDEGAVRGRSARATLLRLPFALPWRAPASRFRCDCPNCELTRGPAGAAGRRSGAKLEPQLRTRLEDVGGAQPEPQAAPCSACRQMHRHSAVYKSPESAPASLFHHGNGTLRSAMHATAARARADKTGNPGFATNAHL